MIYNFNLGIGWASSGVEYAQVYRAKIFRRINQSSKFVFTDMFLRDNLQSMTKNIGFQDDEIIWLYSFFTDTGVSPVEYTLSDFEESLGDQEFTRLRINNTVKYAFKSKNDLCIAYLEKNENDKVHRVEYISNGLLVRKDYFTFCRIFSEYYAPLDGKAHLYLRRFYNRDGRVAFDEITDNDNVMYRFKDEVIYSKDELVAYMVRRLNLSSDDIVIIDRTSGIGQAIMQNAKNAKIGIVVHAEHFSEGSTDEDNILWNNYYEYSFTNNRFIDFYITSTEKQKEMMEEQFSKYNGVVPNIIAIPVGSIDNIKKPAVDSRKKHSLITASRLASEKHIDWIIRAVAEARKTVPDVTLDVYGKGGEQEKLEKIITELGAEEYITLCGHHDLADVYTSYEAYISASTSEGFGLTLLEAIGSGLPIIGFNVRYGNQTFIEDGENGYLIEYDEKENIDDRIEKMSSCIIKMLTEDDICKMHEKSYSIAEKFLTREVEIGWEQLIQSLK